jgi:diguanylate cyclase (GGDEF)-like protein
MKIQSKFTFLIIPLIIVPIFLVGLNAYNYLFESSKTKALFQMRANLDAVQQRIDQEQKQALGSLQLLASDTVVQHYAVAEDEFTRISIYQAPVLERFHKYHLAHSQYQEIRFILPDGYQETYWALPRFYLPDVDESNKEWLKQLSASGERSYSELLISSEPVLKVYQALNIKNKATDGYHDGAKLRGYLAITVNLPWLTDIFNSQANAGEEYMAIMDHTLKFSLASSDLDKTQQASLNEFLNAQHLTSEIDGRVQSVKLGQQLFYIVCKQILGDYFVLSMIPQSSVSRAAGKLSMNLIVITATAIVFTILLLMFVLRNTVVRPLQQLSLASKAIGKGKLDTRITLDSCEEFSELSDHFNNMSEKIKKSAQEIQFMAYHDALTLLPNRRMFQYLLSNNLASAKRKKETLALLFLDLDNFKTINDDLGHEVGDLLLKSFAARIGQTLREEDTIGKDDSHKDLDLVSRLGGDEFTVVLPHLHNHVDASVVAQRILKAMQTAFVVEGHQLYVSTSIGIALYPGDANDVEGLVKCADIAMYNAKMAGRNTFKFFTQAMNVAIINRVQRESELHEAIEKNHLILHFQPQVNIQNGDFFGVEALVRWQHPERGLIPPNDFISLAEETGMILKIGQWVLFESCRQARVWVDMGLHNFKMSVNVSSVQFQRQKVAELVAQALAKYQLDARFLTLEITESVLMSAEDTNRETLLAIKKTGVSLAIDDFGTGYSSLSFLRQFPVNTLKIDRAFIVQSRREPEVKAIISAIIIMAHALGLTVVAEGVENQEELEFLIKVKCDYVQGYYYSKPLCKDQFLEYYQKYNQ